jgi:hypothetical protein
VAVLLTSCGEAKTTGIASADEFAGRWFTATRGPIPSAVLRVSLGPSRCGWAAVVLMDVAWPPGSRSPTGETRQFVRDPYGKVSSALAGRFESVATLPGDARDTGFHHGIWRLSFADSDPGDAYVVGPSKTERWPLQSPPLSCA